MMALISPFPVCEVGGTPGPQVIQSVTVEFVDKHIFVKFFNACAPMCGMLVVNKFANECIRLAKQYDEEEQCPQ